MKRIIFSACAFVLAGMAGAATLRVAQSGDGSDGLSWASAYQTPAAAVAAANSGDEIWVQQGAYLLAATIEWKSGVNVYGGFVGTETARGERSSDPALTVLDGQKTVRVLATSAPLLEKTRWNGFTIQNGYRAYTGSTNASGGGVKMHTNAVLENCIVRSNSANVGTGGNNTGGGGIHIVNNAAASAGDYIMVKDCKLIGNAARYGGGIFIGNDNPTGAANTAITVDVLVENTEIINNSDGMARGVNGNGAGGAVVIDALAGANNPVVFRNCVVANNQLSNNAGGAVSISNTSNVSFTNCTFAKNYAGNYGGSDLKIGGTIASPGLDFTNCIFWGSAGNTSGNSYHFRVNDATAFATLTNCLFDSQAKASGNAANLLEAGKKIVVANDNSQLNFASPTTFTGVAITAADSASLLAADWSLVAGSLAIDSGATVSTVLTDIVGVSRPQNEAYDIGAYELPAGGSQPEPAPAFVSSSLVATALYLGDTLRVSAKISKPATIKFYVNGNEQYQVNGDSLYYEWKPTTIGSYTIKLGAVYSEGEVFTSEASITVDCQPIAAPVVSGSIEVNEYASSARIEATDYNPAYTYTLWTAATAGEQLSSYTYPNLTLAPLTDDAVFYLQAASTGCTPSARTTVSISVKRLAPVFASSEPSGTLNIANGTPITVKAKTTRTSTISFYVDNLAVANNGGLSDSLEFVWTPAASNTRYSVYFGAANPKQTSLEATPTTAVVVMVGSVGSIVHHVNASVSASGDGSSWAAAFKTMEEATAAAADGDQIWVAKGDYLLTATLPWKSGVNVYGGFEGTETALAQRSNLDPALTILDGQGAVRVLSAAAALAKRTVWDGFTIQNGKITTGTGAGVQMHANAAMNSCLLRNNLASGNGNNDGGGAIYINTSAEGSVSVTGCRFEGNNARFGGAIRIGVVGNALKAEVVVENCLIINNGDINAGGSGNGAGAALCVEVAATGSTGNIAIRSCVLANNQISNNAGAALSVANAQALQVHNCTFANNYAGNYGGSDLKLGGVIASPGVDFTNCIFWGSAGNTSGNSYHFRVNEATAFATLTNCLFDGLAKASGNAANLLEAGKKIVVANDNSQLNFASPTTFTGVAKTAADSTSLLAADWSILAGSLAIDSGVSLLSVLTDINGVPRPQLDAFDIGAYEYNTGYTPNPAPSFISYEPASNQNLNVGDAVRVTAKLSYPTRIALYVDNTEIYSVSSDTLSYVWMAAEGVHTLTLGAAHIGGAEVKTTPVTITATCATIATPTVEAVAVDEYATQADIVVSDFNPAFAYTLWTAASAGEELAGFTYPTLTFATPIIADAVYYLQAASGSCAPSARAELRISVRHLAPVFASSTPNGTVELNNGESLTMKAKTTHNATITLYVNNEALANNSGLSDSLEYVWTPASNNARYSIRFGATNLSAEETFTTPAIVKVGNVPTATYHVAASVSASGDGSSWSAAFKSLGEAIAAAADGDQIWVKQGTYLLTQTLTWKGGVNVYGGFAGTETEAATRSTDATLTILDGQNACRVLASGGQLAKETTWSTFTIQHGTFSGTTDAIGDGGSGVKMHHNTVLDNCIIRNNEWTMGGNNLGGAGILIVPTQSEPEDFENPGRIAIIGCKILDNRSTANTAGGIYIGPNRATAGFKSNIYITNTEFINNYALNNGAGLVTNFGAATTGRLYVENCIFANNEADGNGAAVFINNEANPDGLAQVFFNNCNIVRNKTNETRYGGVGGIYVNFNIPLTATNCVFWGNSVPESVGAAAIVDFKGDHALVTITTCAFTGEPDFGITHNVLTAGGYVSGTVDVSLGNSTTKFKAPVSFAGCATSDADRNACYEKDAWALLEGSKLIDAGSPISSLTFDIVGTSRPKETPLSSYDIGAYEYTSGSTGNTGIGDVDKLGQPQIYSAAAGTITVINGDKPAQLAYVYSTMGRLIKVAPLTAGENIIAIAGTQLVIVKAGATVKKVLVK